MKALHCSVSKQAQRELQKNSDNFWERVKQQEVSSRREGNSGRKEISNLDLYLTFPQKNHGKKKNLISLGEGTTKPSPVSKD